MTNYTWIKLYSKDKKSLEQFKEFVTNLNNKWKNTTFSIKDKKKKKTNTYYFKITSCKQKSTNTISINYL